MKSYSKGKLNIKRLAIITIILVLVFIISFISLFLYIKYKNYFKYERIDSSAIHVNDDIAKNSYPIIVNNVILGAVYNQKWVSAARYENNSINKIGTEMDLYNLKGMYGTFKITEMKNVGGNSIAYTEKPNFTTEYYGVKKGSINYPVKVYNENSNEKYLKLARKALKKYKFLNDSIRIANVYSTTLDNKENSYIIEVTSDKKDNNFGAYSAIVYANDFGKSNIIKYNYVVNTKDSQNFNIYSVKFISDFNGDGMNDIIISETSEFETKYSIVEFKNNKFSEVLSSKIN